MSKATWSPEDQRWLDAHPGEGMPPDPYWHNGRREIGPRSPWVPVAPTAEEKQALVKEGREISRCQEHRDETLMALAQIVRIGSGK